MGSVESILSSPALRSMPPASIDVGWAIVGLTEKKSTLALRSPLLNAVLVVYDAFR